MATSPNLLDAFRWHRQQRDGHYIAALRKPVPASRALELARADVAAGKKRYPSVTAESGRPLPDIIRDRDNPSTAYAQANGPDVAGFRFVGSVEPEKGGFQSARVGELGWFTDPYGDSARDGTGLMWGVVYQLPACNGASRFIAGYQMGGVDGGPVLDLATVYANDHGDTWDHNPQYQEAAREAAHASDELARIAAEEERDYQRAWQSGSRFAQLGEEVAAERADILKLLQERKAAKGAADPSAYPTICATIRGSIASALEAIQEARTKRERLADGEGESPSDFDLAWNTRDPRLVASFHDGAGLPASA